MGRTVKWIKSLLTGKKEREKMHRNHPSAGTNENPATPIVIPLPTPKEKRRWSFRRSSASAAGTKESNHRDNTASKQAATSPAAQAQASNLETENNAQTKEALITAVAADAVQADSAVVQHRAATDGKSSALEQAAAAIKIQSVYRSYLARKALRALRGLVKLQALARGHLVRKQATATLRCMQALVTVQARARAQRIRAAEEAKNCNPHWQLSPRLTNHDGNFRNSYDDTERAVEENIKIVEMDHGVEVRNGYSNHRYNDQMDNRFASHYASQFAFSKLQDYQQAPPSPSPITDMSPRTYSGHFDDYSFATAQSSPHYYYSAISKPDPSSTQFNFSGPDYAETMSYDYPLYPSYMANTESSRAKARSQSAPKQRPEPVERQPSVRRRSSAEGRNIPRAVRMQRSSSHLGSTAQNYQYPWSVKLNKSAVSLKDSECGSTCSVRTNTNYCRSLVSFDTHTHRY